MRIGLQLFDLVSSIKVLGEDNGVTKDFNRIFYLLSVKLLQKWL